MNDFTIPYINEITFFLLGALFVWLISRIKLTRLVRDLKTFENQLKHVSELGKQLQQQIEQKDQAISRFISELNRVGPQNEKRTIISIKKFESASNE